MVLGSEIWDPEKPIPDPGVKKAPDPGSGSATLSGILLLDLNYFSVLGNLERLHKKGAHH
jgi:hypothetical protein